MDEKQEAKNTIEQYYYLNLPQRSQKKHVKDHVKLKFRVYTTHRKVILSHKQHKFHVHIYVARVRTNNAHSEGNLN